MNTLRAQLKLLQKTIEDLQKEKSQLKKEKKALVTQVEIREKETAQATREKAASDIKIKKDSSKYDKKLQMYQHELKNKETELFRIKKQMTKILDEKTTFSNSYIEVKKSADMKRIAKICDEYRSKGDLEFVEMLKNGFDSTYNTLVEENTQLKGCLLSLQTDLKDLIEDKINLITNCESKAKDLILKEVNMKLYRLKIIQPKAFKLSLAENIKDIEIIFRENLERVKKFLDVFINPEKLFKFMDRLREDERIRKAVDGCRSLDDLYELVVGLVSTQPLAKFSMKQNPTGKKDRITARWGSMDEPEEGLYKDTQKDNQSTKQGKYPLLLLWLYFMNLETQSDPSKQLKKKKVEAERKKWENLINNESSNTFFFESDDDDKK